MGTLKESPVVANSTIPYQELGLSKQDLVELYRRMVLTRMVDERGWILNRQGKVAFAISCQGHEATQIALAYCLDVGKDFVLPYYRDLGIVLSCGMTPYEVFLNFLARAEDPNSGGRQMPVHWSLKRAKIVTGSSPVTTQMLHAAGIAFAAKLRHESTIALTCFGEGSSNQGDFHEALNFASLHKLGVIFVCENNGYAITTPQSKEMPTSDVAARAAGYNMPGIAVDGLDILAVYKVMKEATERARKGEGPTLIEAKVMRLQPHSSDDDDKRYRDATEFASMRQNDPIERYRRYLFDNGILTEKDDIEMRDTLSRDIDQAAAAAEAAPLPDPATAFTRIYADEHSGAISTAMKREGK